MGIQTADDKLLKALEDSVFSHDPDWSCTGRADRTGAHGLIAYPAMMVPAMQRDILSSVIKAVPKTQMILDPFVGSGTALTESVNLGLSFVGYDINPLAVLVSRVKSTPLQPAALNAAAAELWQSINADNDRHYAVSFPKQEKWFRRSNSIGLSRIRRAVERIDNLAIRRFFWVAMAETIRCCSNSRTSTYKLHIRPDEQIELLDRAAISTFKRVVEENIQRINLEYGRLSEAGMLEKGRFKGDAKVHLADVCQLPTDAEKTPNVDLVITSPPYGDNRTTVPYGQFSHLALQWIPLSDIDPAAEAALAKSAYAVDAKSIGGKQKITPDAIADLSQRSPAFRRTYNELGKLDGDGAMRWAAYCRDLSKAVTGISKHVKTGGYLAWTVGERRISGVSVPLVKVLNDFHSASNAATVKCFKRKIPTKRMPTRNDIGALMLLEHVCFYRAEGQNTRN